MRIGLDVVTSVSAADVVVRAAARRLGVKRWRVELYWEAWIVYLAALVGAVPSRTLRRWFYTSIAGVSMGPDSTIHWHCRFFRPSGLRLGANTLIGDGAFLDARRGITIGDCVVTGSEVALYTLQHDIDDPGFGVTGGPIVIEDYVYIGPRAIILPSVHIGKGAVVMAGAVVTRDVPEFAVVGGVPARFVRERSHDLRYRPKSIMPFQ
jgi:maltose O-acetyltransferase